MQTGVLVAIFFTVAFKILGSPSLQFLLLSHLPPVLTLQRDL